MAMDIWTYLLVKVGEEAAEISQATAKIINYGPHDCDPRDTIPRTNLDKLVDELNDLRGVVELLRESMQVSQRHTEVFQRLDDPAAIQGKKDRVAHWAQHSRLNGLLSENSLFYLQQLTTPLPPPLEPPHDA